jgi:DNA topoisomerase-2
MIFPGVDLLASPEIDEADSDEDLYVKPAKKKAAVGKVTDFSDKAESATKKAAQVPRKISQSMKPASPPKPKKALVKKLADSSDDEAGDLMDYDELPKPRTLPARPGRGAPKKYVEILSDDEDEDGKGKDESMFEDD